LRVPLLQWPDAGHHPAECHVHWEWGVLELQWRDAGAFQPWSRCRLI
jgi:hypothetical protein